MAHYKDTSIVFEILFPTNIYFNFSYLKHFLSFVTKLICILRTLMLFSHQINLSNFFVLYDNYLAISTDLSARKEKSLFQDSLKFSPLH